MQYEKKNIALAVLLIVTLSAGILFYFRGNISLFVFFAVLSSVIVGVLRRALAGSILPPISAAAKNRMSASRRFGYVFILGFLLWLLLFPRIVDVRQFNGMAFFLGGALVLIFIFAFFSLYADSINWTEARRSLNRRKME